MFCWLSDVNNRNNDVADRATKGVLTSAVSIAEVPASHCKPKTIQFVQNVRRKREEAHIIKLKEIVPNSKEHQHLQ